MGPGGRAARRRIGVLAALGAVVVAAWAPGAGLPVRATPDEGRAEGTMQQAPAPEPPVTLLLATEPARSTTREPVTFVLALDNPGPGEVTLTYSSSQVYEVVVLAGDVVVWRWSDGKGFGAVLTDRTYPPGATLLGRERWDWRDANGAPVSPGWYRAVASLATIPPREGNAVELALDAP